MSRDELIRAGMELKAQGFLPEFNATVKGSNGKEIIFFGKLTEEAIAYAKEYDD